MARSLAAAVAAAALLVAGCSDGAGAAVDLEGSPQCEGDGRELEPGVDLRVPDDEGVATEVSHDEVTLDGSRTYAVSDELLSFSTYDLQLEPMLGRAGQYVQVGLDGDTVVWMAGVAAVIELEEPAVFYIGVFAGTEEGRAAFCDGTTFAVVDGVDLPEPGSPVQVRIDPTQRRAVAVGQP